VPFNLLILPLIGGFLLLSHYRRTKYLANRSDRTRLLLYSALTAVVLVLVARIIIVSIVQSELGVQTADFWKVVAPFEYSGTAVGALVLAGIAILICNWLEPKTELDFNTSWVQKYGTSLEKFLLEASQRSVENKENSLVMVTMDSNKVYIGWVQRLPQDPTNPDSYLSISPLISGYRDDKTQKLNLTSFYDEQFLGLANINSDEEAFLPLLKVLPVNQISIASYFDPEVYLAFQEQESD